MQKESVLDRLANGEAKELAQREFGWGDLISACNREQFIALFQRKPDLLEALDVNGNTPLSSVVLFEEYDLALFLIGEGANFTFRNPEAGECESPFHWVAKSRDSKALTVLREILELDVDLELPGWDEDSALHVAAAHGAVEAIEILVEAGADVNAVNQDHWTPLFYSAFNGHFEATKLLLALGADPRAKDIFEDTPREKALWTANDCLNFLKKEAEEEPKPEIMEKYLVGDFEKIIELFVELH